MVKPLYTLAHDSPRARHYVGHLVQGRRGARTLVGMTPLQRADKTRRYWYGGKRYPFGSRFPLTWEGWLLDAVWVTSFIGISTLLRPDSQHSSQGVGLYFGLIAVFMAIRSW
jgi:hypothetical protein